MSTLKTADTTSLPPANAHLVDELAPHIAKEIERVQRYTVMLNQDGYWIKAMRFRSLEKARTMANSMSHQSGLDVEVRDQTGKVHCSIRH